jgi:hypothetical protein
MIIESLSGRRAAAAAKLIPSDNWHKTVGPTVTTASGRGIRVRFESGSLRVRLPHPGPAGRVMAWHISLSHSSTASESDSADSRVMMTVAPASRTPQAQPMAARTVS